VNAFLRWPLMLLPFALWGTAMAAMKPLLDSLSPPALAWLRLLPAGLALLLAAVALRRPLAVDPRDRPWLLAFALVDGSLFQLLLAAGLADIGAGLGSVLIDSQPLLVALLARTVLGEAINPVGWVGLLIGLAGIACLGLPAGLLRHWWLLGPPLPAVESLGRGELLMLLAAAAMAVGTILARRACRHSDPVAVTAWHLLVGALPPLALAALPAFGGMHGLWPSLDPAGWLLVAYAALPGSALAYGLFFWFASQGDLTGFTSLTFLTPVFALLSAGLLLHESLRPLQWLGVVLALASVLLINRRAVLWQPPPSLQPERV
jgi:drug/metabolite transporter (DMT)-like permease